MLKLGHIQVLEGTLKPACRRKEAATEGGGKDGGQEAEGERGQHGDKGKKPMAITTLHTPSTNQHTLLALAGSFCLSR